MAEPFCSIAIRGVKTDPQENDYGSQKWEGVAKTFDDDRILRRLSISWLNGLNTLKKKKTNLKAEGEEKEEEEDKNCKRFVFSYLGLLCSITGNKYYVIDALHINKQFISFF